MEEKGFLFRAFTSLPVSLVHPIVMVLICAGWVTTWILGLRVRRLRKSSGERAALLEGGSGSRVPASKALMHQRLSSALLFFTVCGMLFGMGNTFARTGQLFPGAHLYGAFALIFCVSANVALAPWLREKSGLRLVHTAIGGFVILFVISQIYSGIPITVSVVKSFL